MAPKRRRRSTHSGSIRAFFILLVLRQADTFTAPAAVQRTDKHQHVPRHHRHSLLPTALFSLSTSPTQPHHRKQNSRRISSKNQVRELFKRARQLEKQGRWQESIAILNDILSDHPKDSHSWLALAKLQARRGNDARQVFQTANVHCPSNVHITQAWAVYESHTNVTKSRELFESALEMDRYNPYVCHAYGLLESKHDNVQAAEALYQTGLNKTSTAALVCSLGELLVSQSRISEAKTLYESHLPKLKISRQQAEVYLAWAWLEEKYNANFTFAEQILETSLQVCPHGKAQVALARLKGRQQTTTTDSRAATTQSLERICVSMETTTLQKQNTNNQTINQKKTDGRVYNAWANLKVQSRDLIAAQSILQRGLKQFPNDPSLWQAAGKVEERLGNIQRAREYYGQSLAIQPLAPALVAYALLTMAHPTKSWTFVETKRLFEEALLIDKSHGPAYNAYAKAVFEREHDEGAARSIYKRGLKADCPDLASIYHGYARFELALGNVNRARDLLLLGLEKVKQISLGTDCPHRARAQFLAHTLGMLELNSNRPLDALEVFLDGMDCYGNSSQLLLGAALCQVKIGNETKARELFEQSVSSDNNHAQAWQAWAVMEMRAGNLKTATTLFECGIRKAPSHGALWQAYGVLQSRVGNVDNARTLFRKGLKKAPSYVPLLQSWASLELRQQNYDAARSLISLAMTRDKRNGSGWLIASEIEEQAGNKGLSNLLLRRGIECCPTNGHLYRALGDALVRSGKINEAREVMEKGIELDPMYAPLYHSLAELEARVFNIEGLAKLHVRSKSAFNANTIEEPPASSYETWGSKIKAGRSSSVPKGVRALAQRIVEEEEEEPTQSSRASLSRLDTMMDLGGEGLFGDLFVG